MNTIRTIYIILNILIAIHIAYFGLFAISGLPRRLRRFAETDKMRHFAVLIPARNEEAVIGNLAESIRKADYPPHLLETFVVTNNCTDKTGETAALHGAQVLECTRAVNNKADVLRFAFDALRSRDDIDSYVIIDADNIVDPGFFREMNKALALGAPAAQCRRTAKNLKPNWVASCYEIYYAMQNAFFNHPREAAGQTASVSGTGWAVNKSVIDSLGFETTTITEDFEFTILCAMDGQRIAYCTDAVIYDEFPSSLKISMTQRMRWTAGMLQALRKYGGRLMVLALKGSLPCLDMFVLCTLPLVILASVILPPLGYFLTDTTLSAAAFYLLFIAVFWFNMSLPSLVSVIKSGGSVAKDIKGILTYPLFMLTWVPILIICCFRHNVKWTPIKHDQTVSIEDKAGK